MDIRPFEESDEAAVVALWQECRLTRPWNDPVKDIARKLSVQRELFLVGTERGKVIASVMAAYEGHRGSVNYLAVSPKRQGHGLGRRMMQRIEALLLERGCPKINLMVRTDNETAIDFYRRLGYRPEDAVPLGKRLISDLPADAP